MLSDSHSLTELSQINVFSSDYDVSSSQGDVGSLKDGADSSVGDVYSGS